MRSSDFKSAANRFARGEPAQPEAPEAEEKSGFLHNLWTGIKFTGILALVGTALGFRKATEATFRRQGLLGGPDAHPEQPNLDAVEKTLKDIERRLDVQANPTNLTGKRQGPITR